MRFGRTNEQRLRDDNARRVAERKRREQPRTTFAWLPTRMTNGELVWLERFHEQDMWTDCPQCWSSTGWWTTHRRAIQ